MWDVFISHDSKDKEEIVRPLAEALRQAGLSVWYDEFVLKPGDSLSQAIRQGQNDSKCAVIILSPNYFANERWAQHELNGFIQREIHLGKPIIPIWHNVTTAQVVRFAPDIADKFAIPTSKGVNGIVQDICAVLKEKGGEEVGQRAEPVKEEPPVREAPKVPAIRLHSQPQVVSEPRCREVFGLDDNDCPLTYLKNDFQAISL